MIRLTGHALTSVHIILIKLCRIPRDLMFEFACVQKWDTLFKIKNAKVQYDIDAKSGLFNSGNLVLLNYRSPETGSLLQYHCYLHL